MKHQHKFSQADVAEWDQHRDSLGFRKALKITNGNCKQAVRVQTDYISQYQHFIEGYKIFQQIRLELYMSASFITLYLFM